MTETPRITAATTPVQGADSHQGGAIGSAGSPQFEELLARLMKLTRQQPSAEEVESPEQLREALRTADDGFVAAMDLRRQLEEAFRRHMP